MWFVYASVLLVVWTIVGVLVMMIGSSKEAEHPSWWQVCATFPVGVLLTLMHWYSAYKEHR